MVVRPDHFRQGLGSMMLQACYRQAQKEGTGRIVTWIWEHNERSLLLHEKNGFMKNGRICRQYIRQ